MASRPIPLGQLQGGGDGGGGWMMTLLVCCISSIISAIVGFFFRKQITGALGKMGGGGGGAAAAAGGGAAVGAGAVAAAGVGGRSAVKGRRLKIRGRRRRKAMRKIGRRVGKMFSRRRRPRRKKRRKAMRKIGRRVGKMFGRGRKGARKIGRRVGRGARKAGKLALKYHPANMARRGFNKSRLGKKFNRSKAGKKFNRGIKKAGRGIKKLFRRRRRCFSPETLVKLQNGNEVAMKDLKLGDVLINGSIVNGVMNILNETNPYYKIHSSELDRDIFVTGSHYIKDGKVYKAVKNFSGAEVTTKIDREVSCLITSDHKIPVGEFVFWDWEDDKIQP
jgi:hypothetical protein